MESANRCIKTLDRIPQMTRLADELFHQVLAFLFYPKKIFEIRQKKKDILCTIKMARSRYSEWGDEDESWAFGVEHLQMQAMNCYGCGEYIIHNDMFRLAEKSYCTCPYVAVYPVNIDIVL